jgi:hypothetical protein
MKQETTTISLRIPNKLLKKLKYSAEKERRTLTAEIVLRLEREYEK